MTGVDLRLVKLTQWSRSHPFSLSVAHFTLYLNTDNFNRLDKINACPSQVEIN